MAKEQSMKNFCIVTLVCSFFLFIPSLSVAVTDAEAVGATQAILTTQGKVKSFDPEKQVLLIKTSKGEKVSIALSGDTVLVGYSSLQEIESKHGVKIWYAVEQDKKVAVKIEKKIEVGC